MTEACVLTASNHPVRIFSHIHSSQEKDYKSANTITFHAIEQGAALFGKAAFAMDRGYEDNKMFLKLDELGQDYDIRLTARRKLMYHNKWTMAAELRNRRKGKVKTSVFYKSHLKNRADWCFGRTYPFINYNLRKLKESGYCREWKTVVY